MEALPFLRFMDIAYRAFTGMPFRFPGLMWVDDTTAIVRRGHTLPFKGVLLDQRTYYRVSYVWISRTAKASTGAPQTHSRCARAHWRPRLSMWAMHG